MVITNKPIDRWLGLAGAASGGVFFLITKTPLTVIATLVLIFGLLIHPIWNFWWIEDAPWRRYLSITLFCFSLILIGWYVWPSQRTTVFLQFEKPEVLQQYSLIAPGKEFGVNIRSYNPGPKRVFHAYGYTKSYVKEAGISTDDEVKEAFEKEIEPIRKTYFAGGLSGPEKGVGPGIWTTAWTPPLTEKQVAGTIDGTVRIYFVSWLAWTDEENRKDSAFDCRWLQKFERFPYSQKDIIWHFCT